MSSPNHRPRKTVRPGRRQRQAVHLGTGLLFLSGLVWLLAHYALPLPGDAARHPLEPWAMRIHGAATLFGMAVLGSLWGRHVVRAWKDGRHLASGGGLLGLEAANGLMKRGMQVTVIHVMPTLMERQLDDVAGQLLQKSLEARGLRFMISAQTQALIGGQDGRVMAVQFKNGTEIPADLVVMAAGIRPNTELAEKIGLHVNRGIVVSDTMQTVTDPRIYAVGECAAHRGIAYGLVAPLFEQGKVCATHLAQFGIGRYTGSQTSTKLKVTGIDLFSAGNFMGGDADKGFEEIVMSDPFGGVYKKLVIQHDKLVGAVLYGDTVDGSWYFKLLRDGRTIADIRDKLMFGESNIGDVGHQGHNKAAAMADSDEVCGCNGVNKGSICKAIKEKGLFTLDEVKKHTKAASSCGSCAGLVEQILASTIGGAYTPAALDTKPMCACTDHSHKAVREAIVAQHLDPVADLQDHAAIGSQHRGLLARFRAGCRVGADQRDRLPDGVLHDLGRAEQVIVEILLDDRHVVDSGLRPRPVARCRATARLAGRPSRPFGRNERPADHAQLGGSHAADQPESARGDRRRPPADRHHVQGQCDLPPRTRRNT